MFNFVSTNQNNRVMTAQEFTTSIIDLKGNLQKYALSLTLDRDNALDLVQDTFLKAIQNQDKFVDATNLKAWVFTIMKNTFINNYRRKMRENTMMDGTQELYYLNMPSDKGSISPESSYAGNEIEKAIDDDEYIIDNIKDVIYNDNLTKHLSMIEINRAIRKYIK